MNQKFWSLFGESYTDNCKKWVHSPHNPVIPATGGSEGMCCCWTANPDILLFQGKRFLYYRGNGILPSRPGERHDRITAAELLGTQDGRLLIRPLTDGPIVDVGAPGSFDSRDVLDPAAVEFGGKVYLYYSAVGDGADSVGLSISEDGVHFEKYGFVCVGRAPDVVCKDGELFMISVKRVEGSRCWVPTLSRSADGIHFSDVGPLTGLSQKGNWDSFALTTIRLSEEDGTYYMMCGGSSYLEDEPDYFGLARSRDLLHWEEHPGNPVFGCGPKGSEDGGAIWFPAVFEEEDHFAMIYEGSRGKYSWDLSSQICLSTIAK